VYTARNLIWDEESVNFFIVSASSFYLQSTSAFTKISFLPLFFRFNNPHPYFNSNIFQHDLLEIVMMRKPTVQRKMEATTSLPTTHSWRSTASLITMTAETIGW